MSELIRMYNKYTQLGENKSLLRKALDSATNVGEALVPQFLEEVITNTIVRLSVVTAMMSAKFDNQKLHEFNRLTALPSVGGAMGESATTPTRNSAYERTSVALKVVRRKGTVSGFLRDASAKYIDSQAAEMENHLIAQLYDLDFYNIYGNAPANQFEWSGWDTFVGTNRINEVLNGFVPENLEFLDRMIDNNLVKQGSKHRRAFIMSPQMLSKVSRLLTNVRLNQGLTGAGLSQIDVPGGWRMNAYRDIPIIESTFVRPTKTMTTVVATPSTSGGSLADDTYDFRVTPMTYEGEQIASAIASATVSGGGGSGKVDLTFTADTDALSYKVYGAVQGSALKLIKIVSAFQYDGTGTITGSTVSIEIQSLTASVDVPVANRNDIPFINGVDKPEEVVALIDLDEFQGLGKLAYTNTEGDRFNGLVTIKPLAETDDNTPFLIKTYAALVPSFEETSTWNRGLRAA